MDQRDVLRLVDRVTQENLMCCTRIMTAAPTSDEEPAGYLYGPEPAVHVLIEFEAYFFRDIYEPLMPSSVRRRLDGHLGTDHELLTRNSEVSRWNATRRP